MPKLNLAAVLRDIDGKPHAHMDQETDPVTNAPLFHDSTGNPKMKYLGDLTLRQILYAAVNATYEEEGKPGNDVLFVRGKLARKVKDPTQDEKNFSTKEVEELIKCCGFRLRRQPEMFFSIVELLDPDREELKVNEEKPSQPKLT